MKRLTPFLTVPLLVIAATLGGVFDPAVANAADADWVYVQTVNWEEASWWLNTNWSDDTLPATTDAHVLLDNGVNKDFNLNIWDAGHPTGVSLPDSYIQFDDFRTTIVAEDGAGEPVETAILEANKISAKSSWGSKIFFYVHAKAVDSTTTGLPGTIATTGNGGIFYEGLTTTNMENGGFASQILAPSTVTNMTLTANLLVDAPLTAGGASPTTTINKGARYTSTNVEGVLPGTVDIAVAPTNDGKGSGGGLIMMKQAAMPTMINVQGMGAGLVIDDASGMVFETTGQTVNLQPDSAFREQTAAVDVGGGVMEYLSTSGNGPTAGDLPGLIYWAMDKINNTNLDTNVYTLIPNSATNPDSPYKGFAFGQFSDGYRARMHITLKMGPGETGNMKIATSLGENNYSRFDKDTTLLHSGAPGASTTADILMISGLASSGPINQTAIAAGKTNLIDTFHFEANTPGMRLIHQTVNNSILPGQEWQLDNGYMTYKQGGNSIQGTLRLMEGGMLVWDGSTQLDAEGDGGGTIVIEDGGCLGISNNTVLDNLTAAQIETSGSKGMLMLNVDFDSSTASGRLLDVISRTNIIAEDEKRFLGTNGLILGAGKYLGNAWNNDCDVRASKIASATGDDLRLAAFGTRQLRLQDVTLDAGTNDVVIGTDPGDEIYSPETAGINLNSSGPDGEIRKMQPTGTVIFDDPAMALTAGGINVKSGTLRSDITLAVDRININGTLSMDASQSATASVLLSGSGNFSGGTGLSVPAGGTIAPGSDDALGTLTSTSPVSLAGKLSVTVQGNEDDGTLDSDALAVNGASLTITTATTDLIELTWLPGTDATAKFGGEYVVAKYDGAPLTLTGLPNADAGKPVNEIGVAYIQSITYDAVLGEDPDYDNGILVNLYQLADGDINLDGKVDVSDLTILSQSWDVLGDNDNSWLTGDMTFDGAVDVSDLSILSQAWAPGGVTMVGAEADTTAIPEPTSAMMLLLAAAGLLGYRRRR